MQLCLYKRLFSCQLDNTHTQTHNDTWQSAYVHASRFDSGKGNPQRDILKHTDYLIQQKSDELDEFARAKLERDLLDLQRLIGAHFEERKKDEEDLVDLKDRIVERKQMREAQIKERARKQQERDMIKKMEKEKKENEEEERRLAEEQKVEQCVYIAK